MYPKFNIIVAVDSKMGIGKENSIPWRLPSEMKYFQEVTSEINFDLLDSRFRGNDNAEGQNDFKGEFLMQNAVIMGRKTWDSIPENRRPLKNRLNVVLTRNENLKVPDDVIALESFSEALEFLRKKKDSNIAPRLRPSENMLVENIFVIGGQSIYEEAIKNPDCSKIYLTEVEGDFGCDKFFPQIPEGFEEIEKSDVVMEEGIRYWKKVYKRAGNSKSQAPSTK